MHFVKRTSHTSSADVHGAVIVQSGASQEWHLYFLAEEGIRFLWALSNLKCSWSGSLPGGSGGSGGSRGSSLSCSIPLKSPKCSANVIRKWKHNVPHDLINAVHTSPMGILRSSLPLEPITKDEVWNRLWFTLTRLHTLILYKLPNSNILITTINKIKVTNTCRRCKCKNKK